MNIDIILVITCQMSDTLNQGHSSSPLMLYLYIYYNKLV